MSPYFDEVSHAVVYFGHRRAMKLWERRLDKEHMKFRMIELASLAALYFAIALWFTWWLLPLAMLFVQKGREEAYRYTRSGCTYRCHKSIELCGI